MTDEFKAYLGNPTAVLDKIVCHTKYNRSYWTSEEQGKHIARLLLGQSTIGDDELRTAVAPLGSSVSNGLRRALCETDRGLALFQRIMEVGPLGRDIVWKGYYSYWFNITMYGGDSMADTHIYRWKDQALKFAASIMDDERESHQSTWETIMTAMNTYDHYRLYPEKEDIEKMMSDPAQFLRPAYESLEKTVSPYALGVLCGTYVDFNPEYAADTYIVPMIGGFDYMQLKGFFRVFEYDAKSKEEFLSGSYKALFEIYDKWCGERHEKNDYYSEDWSSYHD